MKPATAGALLLTVLLVHAQSAPRRQLRRQLYCLAPRALVLEAATDALALDLIYAHCRLSQVPRSLLVLLDAAAPGRQRPQSLVDLTQMPTLCYDAVTAVACTAGAPAAGCGRGPSCRQRSLPAKYCAFCFTTTYPQLLAEGQAGI